jgi:hypothetical protein
MKKLFLPLLLATVSYASSELKWVDEQIEAIKPARVGLNKQDIAPLKDPFILLVKKEEKKEVKKAKKVTSKYLYKKRVHKKSYSFKLEAIMNKSALINGKWYKEGSPLYGGYSLLKVGTKSVVLKKGSKRRTLSTVTKNQNLKFKKN